MSKILLDVETCALDSVIDYFNPAAVKVPANYTKADAIENHLARETRRFAADAAKDPDLCRVACLGYWPDESREPIVGLCRDEAAEKNALEIWWAARGERRIVGYNIAAFDMLVLYRRSLYLGVPAPPMRRGKYSYQNPELDDLFLLLSDDGRLPWRPVSFYARRFGIAVPADPYTGADMPRLAASGDWEAITHHCRCDLVTERGIAARLGVMSPSEYVLVHQEHGTIQSAWHEERGKTCQLRSQN